MTKNQKRAGLWVVSGAVLLALMVAYNPTDHGTPTEYESAPYTAPVAITAEMVVDAMGTSQQVRFCDAYLVVGEAGFPTFAANYTEPQPSAVEVFDELASRC